LAKQSSFMLGLVVFFADRPWVDLELPWHANTLALFSIAVTTQVGNGKNTLFWTDQWLHGCSISELAPTVVARFRPQIKTKRTVAEALENNAWVSDIQGGLSMIRSQSTCTFGMVLGRLRSPRMMINIFGDLMTLEHTLPSLPTELSSMVRWHLSLGDVYGSHGPLENVNFLFGSPSETDVGQRIGLLAEDCHIQRDVHYATKRRLFNTCSLIVCSHVKYGSAFFLLWRWMKQYHNRTNIALLIGGPSAFVESRSTRKGLIR
jgi:hypothetical protein